MDEGGLPADQTTNAMEDDIGPIVIEPPKMIRRNIWGAMESDLEDVLSVPASHVLLTCTGGLECHKPYDCALALKKLQRRDMEERGLRDIQYNFYVGGDGVVYEGRGFYFRSTKEPQHQHLEDLSMDIAFIGDFSYKDPTDEMYAGAAEIVEYMIKYKFVRSEFTLINLGASQKTDGGDEKVQEVKYDADFAIK